MYLGLDLGTTNVKALLVAPEGTVHQQASVPVPLHHSDDGGIEQDIGQIRQATLDAIRQVGQQAPLRDVKAVGVSSQGGALQIRTDTGDTIGPVISWLDPRGQEFDRQITERQGADWFAQHCGHGSSATAVGQILRLRHRNPDVLAWPNRIGFVGDTIVKSLCGRAAHDASSLHLCDMYNPSRREADPELLSLLKLRPEQLPDLLNARETAGVVIDDISRQTGLPAGIPVSPAIHDQYAAALGCGALASGDVMFGAGTAWVLLAIADQRLDPVVPSAWVCDHVVPQRWGQLISLVVGGSVFTWALSMTDMADKPAADIDTLLGSVAAGSDGLRLYPFLDGTGGPGRLDHGMIGGIRFAHGRAHLLRAAVEGLCLELTRQLDMLERAGAPAKRLIMCGGASGSTTTTQIVADVTGRPVTCPEQTEISAFGAAILARAIHEPDASLETLAEQMLGPARRVSPGTESATYTTLRDTYNHLIERHTEDDHAGT